MPSAAAPVARRRGWSALELDKTKPEPVTKGGEGYAKSAPDTGAPPVELFQLARTDDGGWRLSLALPPNVASMQDVDLDIGEQELRVSFASGRAQVFELPHQLQGIPTEDWKARFSRKRRELSLEVSSVKDPNKVQASPEKEAPAAEVCQRAAPADKDVRGSEVSGTSLSSTAPVVQTSSAVQESDGSEMRWGVRNTPFGPDGDSELFDQQVVEFKQKVSKLDASLKNTLTPTKEFESKVSDFEKSLKHKPNGGLMFDQATGKQHPVEIDPEAVDIAGVLMAHSFAATGNTERLKKTIQAGVSVNATDDAGTSLLEKACMCGHVGAATLLLEMGALARGVGLSSSTPLHRAAANPGAEGFQLARLLLAHNAQPGKKDSSGRTAADIAKLAGGPVSALLEAA